MSAAATELALREAIEDAPDDETARMVYADWLLERGDPRGELIQVQTARRADPWWAHPRLERRDQRLRALLPRTRTRASLFDRGEEGWDLQVGDRETRPRRWLLPRRGSHASSAEGQSAIAAFAESELFANVRRLDLRGDVWHELLSNKRVRARPRHVVLPVFVNPAWLREAPLLERVEHLELLGSVEDGQLEELLAAPWAQNLVRLTMRGASYEDLEQRRDVYPRGERFDLTDVALVAVANAVLPRLRVLDARDVCATARGVEALAGSALPLGELHLAADQLGSEGLAALERSRLAGITRVALAGPWLQSPDAVVALVRSSRWDGALDFTRVANPADHEATLATLATIADARPLRVLCGAAASRTFFESPFARSLAHVSAFTLPDLGTHVRLTSLRVLDVEEAALAQPALAQLERLSIRHLRKRAMAALADAPMRLVDLELEGHASTTDVAQLLRSPVLERVQDLSLALRGELASKPITRVLVDPDRFQHVQRLELDFLSGFPIPQRAEIEARFGAAVYPRFVRS